MKAFVYVVLFVFAATIISCSGSDVYRGNWKAMDRSGNKFDMAFDANSFTLKDAKGTTEKYEYTQTSIKIENSVRSYSIKLKDGRVFTISFPLPDDTSKGLIGVATGEALYTIGRNDYVEFSELLKF